MKKIRTIVDLITTRLRISLTWRKSRLTQKKRSRRKKRRKKKEKIRNRRPFVLIKSKRSRRLRRQIASVSEWRSLTRRKKMRIMSFRDHLRMMMMKIVWGNRLCFCFLFIFQIEIPLLFRFNLISRSCSKYDNQRDICITKSY